MSGTEVSLLLNGSTPIVLSSYLANASNLTSFFEGATENLADYYLYNNAGFVFAFMNIEGNICEPVLLFNNEISLANIVGCNKLHAKKINTKIRLIFLFIMSSILFYSIQYY